MQIIMIIIGLVCGIGICYFSLKPKLDKKVVLNLALQEQNKEIVETSKKLREEQAILQKDIIVFEKERANLEGRNLELQKQFEQTKNSADKAADAIYSQAYELMEKNLVEAAEDFQEAKDDYQDEYLTTLADSVGEFINKIEEYNNRIAEARSELEKLDSRVKAAVAANIREEEKKNNTQFYTLGLTEIDSQEVKKIKEIIPYLRNGRPVCKAIWEAYYRNATTDLISRIVGAGSHTGIYKITCLLDNKIYIGQAVNIGDRWKQHIKCGIGIDTPSNKLYTAMLKQGVENFTFEVLEECPSKQLNEKEKYWIGYYQSNIYGYNMSSGGSRGDK